MANWRPEGWKPEFGLGQDNMEYRDAFEAGADAMLSAVKNIPDLPGVTLNINNPEQYAGKWAVVFFIPDEEDLANL